MSDLQEVQRRVLVTGRSARFCLLLLIGLCVVWELWWAPTGRGTLALKVVPLVCALPGIWRGRLYTHRWLSLLVWAYAAEGAVRAVSDHGSSRWLAAAEVLLAIMVFVACGLQVRAQLSRDRIGSDALRT